MYCFNKYSLRDITIYFYQLILDRFFCTVCVSNYINIFMAVNLFMTFSNKFSHFCCFPFARASNYIFHYLTPSMKNFSTLLIWSGNTISFKSSVPMSCQNLRITLVLALFHFSLNFMGLSISDQE